MKKIFTVFFLAFAFLSACKKDKSTSDLFVGKWRFIEYYNGFPANCYCWQTISPAEYDLFDFSFTGTYNIKYVTTGTYGRAIVTCKGTYKILNDSTVALRNCHYGPNTGSDTKFFITADTLIFEYPVSQGVHKIKFVRM